MSGVKRKSEEPEEAENGQKNVKIGPETSPFQLNVSRDCDQVNVIIPHSTVQESLAQQQLIQEPLPSSNIDELDPRDPEKDGEIICQLLEKGLETSLRDKWFHFILKHAKIILADWRNLRHLNETQLTNFLSHQDLQVENEAERLRILFNWAKSKFDASINSKNPITILQILKNILPKIPFTFLPFPEILGVVSSTKIVDNMVELNQIVPLISVNNVRSNLNYMDQLPPEIFVKIFKLLPHPLLLNIRLVSSLWREVIDKNFEFEIILDDSSLQNLAKVLTDLPQEHPFTTINFKTEELTEETAAILNEFLGMSKFKMVKSIKVKMEIIYFEQEAPFNLFMENLDNNVRVDLTIQKFGGHLNVFEYTAQQKVAIFNCLRSIQIIEFMKNFGGIQFLKIIQKCANLQEISIGQPTPRDRHRPINSREDDCWKVVLEYFLKEFANTTQNVAISLYQFPPGLSLEKDNLRESSARKIHFKNVTFQRTENGERAHFCMEFATNCHPNLQQLHGLILPIELKDAPIFQRKFNQLTSLEITCYVKQLLVILKNSPKLKYLSWLSTPTLPQDISADVEEATALFLEIENIVAASNSMESSLASLTIFIKRKEDMRSFKVVSMACPKVKELTCWIMCEDNSINEIYDHFPQIEFLWLRLRPYAVNLTGLDRGLIDDVRRDPSFKDRPPYIGNLKELKTLNLGLGDFDLPNPRAHVLLPNAFTHGIFHVLHLQKIILPPLVFTDTDHVLSFLAYNMKELLEVDLQVWGGQHIGAHSTLTPRQAHSFKLAYVNAFKIRVVVIQAGTQN